MKSGRAAITTTIENRHTGGSAPLNNDLPASPIPAEKGAVKTDAPAFHVCFANVDLDDDRDLQRLCDLFSVSSKADVTHVTVLLESGNKWQDIWLDRLKTASQEGDYQIKVMDRENAITYSSNIVKGNQECEVQPGKLQVAIFPTYCGRQEIIAMAKRILTADLSPQDLTPANLSQFHALGQMPECDMIVFFGKQQSLADGPLWSAAYAEFEFVGAPLVDVDPAVFAAALNSFSQRERRFGALAADPKEGGVA